MDSKFNNIDSGISSKTGSPTSWLTLFASSTTFICCALPLLLVSLGMGASVAFLTSSFPQLIWLSEHKNWIFLISALVLTASGWSLFHSGRQCPTDPAEAANCARIYKLNQRMLYASICIWSVGFFTAFLLLPLRLWMEAL
ncbi:MAG: hypothetical protein ABGX33_08165 [Cycloclasticus sp.]